MCAKGLFPEGREGYNFNQETDNYFSGNNCFFEKAADSKEKEERALIINVEAHRV